jgi:hypothetical protein
MHQMDSSNATQDIFIENNLCIYNGYMNAT